MKANKTTTTATVIGGAVGVLIVWGLGLAGVADIPTTVAAAITTICVGVFGIFLPLE